MKKALFIPALLLHGLSCIAQGTADSASGAPAKPVTTGSSAPVHRLKSNDQVLPPWAIDFNYRSGWLEQGIEMFDLTAAYGLNLSPLKHGTPIFTNGRTNGVDIHLNYFFNDKRTLGVGIGATYMRHTGDMTLDTLAWDYKEVDTKGRIYRQMIHSNEALREDVRIDNLNIPVLLRFKHQFGRPDRPSNFGITADAGPVFGIYNQTTATASGNFSYEAVYKIADKIPGQDGATVYVSGFDASPVPNSVTSYIIDANNFPENVIDNFYTTQGFNVGLKKSIKPSQRTQDKSYKALSFGAMVQAGLSYAFSYKIAFNVSGYYMYQSWQNTDNDPPYRPTEKVQTEGASTYGNYAPLTGGIKKSDYTSYGLSAGLRIFFGEKRDVDGDKIPDAKDKCKLVYGEARFGGCPDSDHDGIPDTEDDCAYEPGGEATNGCPDDDNDGVPNKVDACPYVAGALKNGCPIDTNYIIRSNMPIANIDSSLRRENGTFLPPHQVLETDVLHFAFARADIQDSVAKILDFAANLLATEPRVIIYISGYTDDIGSSKNNIVLSYQRAKSAQIYLLKKGISEDRIILGGYGKENPVIPNNSPENRAKNRRIEMKLLLPL